MIKPQNLQTIINQGESLFTEFKEQILNWDSLAAEIVAIANTEGGRIIIGVDDDGQIKGIVEPQGLEEKIVNVLRNNVEPSLQAEFSLMEIDGKVVGVLEIPKSMSRPHRTNKGIFYIRVGTAKRHPSREELSRIYQDVGQVRYDLEPVQSASIDDLDLNTINNYYQKFYHESLFSSHLEVEDVLINLEFLSNQKNEQSKRLATIAGILLFGKEPQKHLPQSAVSVGVYQGFDLASPMKDRQEIKGTLEELFNKIWEYFRLRFETKYEHNQGKRIEVLEYPEIAVREMIVNALVHRNYSITGEQIRAFLFNDKFWVSSPGRLPNTITLDNITFRRHSRNPLIAEIMWNLGYVEKSGSGILRIIEAMQKHNQTKPKLEVEGEEFRVAVFKK